IDIINDTVVEAAETVNLTLAANSAYTVGAANSATVNIADNDTLPIVTITASDANAGETDSGIALNPGQFTFTRTGST
ncbi:hypothetical protein, partial [Microseira wollei]|uniref:hypothetical protein n=1 Tax=Microseira wollei TaxID=467598 RepID=UPI001CFF281B